MANRAKRKIVTSTKSPQATSLSTERIARLAYQKYEERGCVQGHDQEDWLKAEAELKAQTSHHN